MIDAKKTGFQFVKYGVVGGIGGVITIYANLLFQRFGIPEYIDLLRLFPVPWALGLAILCAIVSNFLLNKFWTFREDPNAS